MKQLFLVILIATVCSCASIPLATMLKFSGFDEHDFIALDAEQIRCKVSVSHPFTINLTETNLSLAMKNQQGERNFSFPLLLTDEESIPVRNSLFFSEPAKNQYSFKLSQQAVSNFAEIQGSLRRGMQGNASFSVSTSFNESPQGEQTVQFSIQLQLSERDGFFTLIDNAEIKVGNGN